jgi:hypothetical protein
MSTVAWRRLLLGLCTLAIIVVGFTLATFSALGNGGIVEMPTSPTAIEGTATGTSFVDRTTVYPHSVAYRAGLRTGDLVDLRLLSAADRYRWTFGHFRRGARMVVPVVRGNRVDRFSITFGKISFTWDVALAYIGYFWVLLFAAFIAWRRAESAEARVLVLLLNAWVLGLAFQPNSWGTPWIVPDAVAGVLGAILTSLGYALLATYAMLFVRPPSILRRALAWLSYGSAGVAAFYAIAAATGVWTLTADPVQSWYSGIFPQTVTGVFPLLFPLLCMLVTLAQSRGAERARMAWASVSVGPLYVWNGAVAAVAAFQIEASMYLLFMLANVAMFIAPIGLTYALLSRRLLDVGFVINQAAVFSGVSIVVVGLFMLGEWVLGTWFSHVGHLTNVEISAALAIGLGFSVRAIHTRVDGALDRVFFRKRHDDETAIRAFADEAAEVTDDATLLRRTKETLETHADASFVTLAMNDGAGHFGDVSENDPAIAALHERHKALDLQTLSTALRGDFAYPMIARGRLVGALVLGPKRSGESYAPDESHAIMHLARSVGGALHILFLAKVLQEHNLQARFSAPEG